MLARILGTTAIALALSAPVAAAGTMDEPALHQQRSHLMQEHWMDQGIDRQSAELPREQDGYGGRGAVGQEAQGTIAPKSMEPRNVYPQQKDDAPGYPEVPRELHGNG